ncbi:MAG: 1-acyl-sn-glycerol-3-phosphate acyltransferase [Crocinitomicaceae bacterium]|nr:1-acyl-sn-glycerol-3-phosphate acyltransferase [Crocinitomicaceae bacterium]
MSKKEDNDKFIDIDKVLKDKNPKLHKWSPPFFVNYLKKITHQERVNNILLETAYLDGFEFCRDILKRFNISLEIHGLENVPTSGKCVLASNHPLGGFDALALVQALEPKRKDLKFVVNDILLGIKPLKDLFVGINKHGKTAKDAMQEMNDLFASDQAVIIFPSGLVSRKKKGKVRDLTWKKTFVTQSKKNHSPILPVYIEGELTPFFYGLSNLRSNMGVKVNIEMLYLVDELMKQKDKTIKIIFGKPIEPSVFDKSLSDHEWADWVKDKVYDLS